MIYELREYTAVPGRMAAMVKRFNEESLRLFKKHGMEVVFLSLTTFGRDTVNELVYVLKFDSEQDLATKWQAFYADPEWHTVRDESEVDGPLVVSVGRRVLSPDAFNIS
ncbi:hypothetical protein ED28_04310 [[Pantoea] beijingensis]|uniref:NIPSNAP domain-containing protein n=1 Tax=[Pantoea] beijingensis TaxID=1324864 RepID=A0A443IG48_9GAMM|nr:MULTISPECIES: NIPSNAP family protein [Erwiniaceae]RWR03029.1 hypothetical protein ED28_04310 [[Pantoea] beijingensis]